MRASRFSAARVLARSTCSKRSGVRPSSTPSSSTPAAWTTAVSRCCSGIPASRAASASRSATSQATAVAVVPVAASSAVSSATPGASGPRLLTSSSRVWPRAASRRATWAPSAPVPPVISTVPPARGAGAVARELGTAATRRRAKTPSARIATWSSTSPARASPAARTAQSRFPARASRVSGRSIKPPQAWGSSRAAPRPKPQIWAWAGSGGPSARPVETPPRVRGHSGTSASAQAWVRESVAASPRPRAAPVRSAPVSVPSSETTPASSPQERNWSARAVRSAPGSGRVRTVAPLRRSAPATWAYRLCGLPSFSGLSGATTSQAPLSTAGAGATGRQTAR